MRQLRRKERFAIVFGFFALKNYERDIDNIKKEVKAVSEELEKVKKEGDSSLKLKQEAFQSAVAQEESKLTQLTNDFAVRISQKQRQIEEMTRHAAAISTSMENRVEELKRSGNVLRSQLMVEWIVADPEDPVLVQLPVYLIKYARGEEARYSLFSPIALTEDASVLNGLKKMFALTSEPKLKTLTRPASKKLQETLSANIVEKMERDADFRIRINEVCQASNLIDLNTFGQTLNEGLDEIEKKGWLTKEEAAVFCRRIMGDEA